jgi:hypothetical protein
MVKPTKKSIIFTAVTMINILFLTLPSITLNGFSQTLEVEFKPKINKTIEILDFQSTNTNSTVKEKTPREEIAMKVQLEPHENKYLKDWYHVSNFAFITTNTSKLCHSDTCKYELENGKMSEAFVPGERLLTGNFTVDTGLSKNLMNLSSTLKAVEELKRNGSETIQVIEGTLQVSKDVFPPEHEYKINGTLSTNNNGFILEIKGKK